MMRHRMTIVHFCGELSCWSPFVDMAFQPSEDSLMWASGDISTGAPLRWERPSAWTGWTGEEPCRNRWRTMRPGTAWPTSTQCITGHNTERDILGGGLCSWHTNRKRLLRLFKAQTSAKKQRRSCMKLVRTLRWRNRQYWRKGPFWLSIG